MSAIHKTRFEIQKILRNQLLKGLAYNGYDANSYVVMESNQRPLTASKKDVILFKLISSKRVGWQAPKFRVERDAQGAITGYFRDDCFMDEQEWLISVLTHRPSTDNNSDAITADTRLSEDIADGLIAWFNGYGCVDIRKSGVSLLYISQKPIDVYKDSSSLYEKSASFRVKLIVPSVITHEADSATFEYGGNIPI